MNRTINRLSSKTSWCLRIVSRNCQLETLASASAEKRVFVKPNIPIRIKRNSTDILKAIATTVARDSTSPHYKYHDDPYLYPISGFEKRNYALSKESGKKAARWIKDTHGDLFQHTPDDPIIKDFLPNIKFDENSEVSELDLQNCINRVQVSDAINLYKLCRSKDIDISVDTRQALLELICFYNCEDALDVDWIEERKNEPIPKMSRPVKSWKDGGFAEELFNVLKDTGVKAYCAIIKGMCNYGQFEKAWHLYQEALAGNLIPDTETFNALITKAPCLKEDGNLQWGLIQDILQKMIEEKIPPNRGTMNSMLEALIMMKTWRISQGLSLQILSEFNRLNIEPSLETYYYLLRIHFSTRTSNNILPSILNEIENKLFTVKDLKDDMFFFSAMEICLRDIHSYQTAERVHKFLMNGDNFNFLGGNVKYAIYFRCYFTICVRALPLEEFMMIYEDLVPHLYSPDRDVMEEIVNAINLHDEIKLLPRIWSDCILLELTKSENLNDLVLKTMSDHDLESVDAKVATQLANIVWFMWQKFEDHNNMILKYNRGRKLEWSGGMFGHCLSVLSRCKEPEKALHILKNLNDDPSLALGIIPFESLRIFFKALVKEAMYTEALMVLKYCKDNDLSEDFNLAKDLSKKPNIPEDIVKKIVFMYGENVKA